MRRDVRILGTVAFAAAILMPAMAAAQAPPKAAPPVAPKAEQLDPSGCGNNRATVGEGGEVKTKKPDGQDLSEKLAQSGGVICPPEQIDPAIKAPTPPGGVMPVIPPPGSSGGDQNIQPK